MSFLGRLMTLYPAFNLAVVAACVVGFAKSPGMPWLVAVLAALYLLPVAAFRLHGLFFPLKPGASKISKPGYSPWWGGHQIQLLYIAIPPLEAALRLVPGVYSAWLRLWGSKVGEGVHWTPRVEIIDRNLMTIGDRVVFGHLVKCVAHVVSPTANGEMILLVKPITIENDAFLGAASGLGPGAKVLAGAHLPAFTNVKVGEVVAAGAAPKGDTPC